MCGIYNNPFEVARSLTVAAAQKVVVSQTGKTVEESNIELGKQLSLVYNTILKELQREEDEEVHEHSHHHHHGDHDDGHDHSHSHTHSHSHSHTHDHDHTHA